MQARSLHSPLFTRPPFSRVALGLLLTTYLSLLILSAACTSGSIMPDPHQHAHHDAHHMGLCAWACHVSQTSATVLSGETAATLLLLVCSVPFLVALHIQPTHFLIRFSRGPPLHS